MGISIADQVHNTIQLGRHRRLLRQAVQTRLAQQTGYRHSRLVYHRHRRLCRHRKPYRHSRSRLGDQVACRLGWLYRQAQETMQTCMLIRHNRLGRHTRLHRHKKTKQAQKTRHRHRSRSRLGTISRCTCMIGQVHLLVV